MANCGQLLLLALYIIVMCDVDNMNIYCDISVCALYYYIKLSLHHFIHVIYKVTVFALFFGFLKMNDHMFDESALSNDPSNTKQLYCSISLKRP